MIDESSTDAPHSQPGFAPLSRAPLAWGAIAIGLIAAVFVGGVVLLALVSATGGTDADVRGSQTALILYARIVLPKVLLPHAIGTISLYAIAERWTGARALGLWPRRGVFFVIALVVAAALTAYWLPSNAFGLARIKTRDAANFVSTCIEMSVATTTAALVSRWLLDAFARRRPTPTTNP